MAEMLRSALLCHESLADSPLDKCCSFVSHTRDEQQAGHAPEGHAVVRAVGVERVRSELQGASRHVLSFPHAHAVHVRLLSLDPVDRSRVHAAFQKLSLALALIIAVSISSEDRGMA
jgi:hypothetical protein